MKELEYNLAQMDKSEIKFAFYMKELFEAFSLNLGLQGIIDKARAVLGRPMVIHDTSFKILAASYDAADFIHLIEDEKGNKYISEDRVQYIRSNNMSEILRKGRSSNFIENTNPKGGTLFAPIKIEDIEIARIAIYEADVKFKEIDYKMIELLSHILSVELQKSNTLNAYQNLIPNYIITDLLEGKWMSKDTITSRLHYLKWIHAESLFVCLISNQTGKTLDNKIQLFCKL